MRSGTVSSSVGHHSAGTISKWFICAWVTCNTYLPVHVSFKSWTVNHHCETPKSLRSLHPEHNTTRLGLKITAKQLHIQWNHAGTFPAVRRLQHPLVITFIWGQPFPAQAVNGEVPVPLLLRSAHCQRWSAHTIILWKMCSSWEDLLWLL